jgi:hypothetical protein
VGLSARQKLFQKDIDAIQLKKDAGTFVNQVAKKLGHGLGRR